MRRCHQCGGENSEQARFCQFCGEQFTVKAQERRKLATLLFCDMSGSTAMGEQVDPESVRDLMFRFFHEMRSAIEGHGGTVEKFIGDAVMAVFGVPVAHEDDALRAVRGAMEMLERMETLNEELQRRYGVRVSLRIGVNTGEVVAGDATSHQMIVTGDTVNVAARLEQAAQPGTVLIGPITYRLTRSAVQVEPVAPLPLKGKSEPVQGYRLLAVDPATRPVSPRFGVQFIGRQAEVALLTEAFLRSAEGRRCEVLTVLGEPGVGKSRLAMELRARLAGKASTLTGRCLPYGQGITYWPVREIVRDAVGILDEHRPEQARARITQALGEDEDGIAISDLIAEAVGVGKGGGTATEIAWAFRRFLETLTRRRPLLLLIDDLQWAEPTLLDLMASLPGGTRDAPMLLVCLARPELVEARPEWDVTLRLEPLNENEVRHLVEGLAPGAINEDLFQWVVTAAGGNPLFAEELVGMLADEGPEPHSRTGILARAPAQPAVPASLTALLGARLERLSAEEQMTLELASIEGEVFHRGALATMGPDENGWDPVATLQALADKEVIHPAAAAFTEEAAFRFRHILIRDAAYGRIPKRVRAQLHERFAGWLTERPARGASEYEEIIGYHLEQSYRYLGELGPVDERGRELAALASARLGGAGRRALDRRDIPAAQNLLSRAVALLPAEGRERLQLQLNLALATMAIGEIGKADALLEEVSTRARVLGDRPLEWWARLERADLHMASLNLQAVRLEAEEAQQVFLAGGDQLGVCRTLAILGTVHFLQGEIDRAGEMLQAAVETARRAGSRWDEMRHVGFLVVTPLYGTKPVDQAIRACWTMLEEARNAPGVQPDAFAMIGVLQAMRGELEEGRTMVARSMAMAKELGRLAALAENTISAGTVEMLAGDSGAAERQFREGYEALERMGDEMALPEVAALLARALYEQGRYDEAERYARISQERSGRGNVYTEILWRGIRARLAARRGEIANAERLAREATSMVEKTDLIDLHADCLVDLAIVLRLAYRTDEAVDAAREAVRLYERKGNVVGARRAGKLLG